jgi:sugar lactone lactonase YvrE
MAGFNFADFSDASAISLLGDASITSDNRLRLTPATGGQEGAAWYAADKPFVGMAFDTTFQFQLANNFDSPGGSDGFTFAVQNFAPTYLAGGGGPLGYHNLPNSVVVEFDTFQNSEAGDPSGSHISIHTNGTGANNWLESLSLGSYNTNPILDDANVHKARITYSAGSLSVYLDDLTAPKLTVSLDLANTLALDAGRAWIGFTGTTGGGWQTHDILNWEFESDVPATVIDALDASVAEGDSGTSTLALTVRRTGDLSAAAIVDWATANGTATAGDDYLAASGQVVFDPGAAEQVISLTVNGDTELEPHETLSVVLSNASSGFLLSNIGTGTILNDESAISISDASANEGSDAVKFIDVFVTAHSGGLTRTGNAVYGPDGNLYVVSRDDDSVLSYDGQTGAFIDVVVPSGAEGLDHPWMMTFGPDDRLYVAGIMSNNIVSWDPDTGEVDTFIPPTAGLWTPKGIAFDAAGTMYVANADRGTTDTSSQQDQVLKFAGPAGGPNGEPAGTPLGVFVSQGSGGLDNPNHLAFYGNHLYVTNTRGDSINRYDAATGEFVDVFVPANSGGLDIPNYLVFGPDGYLHVSSQATQQVLRYNAATGAFVDVVVPNTNPNPASVLGIDFDAAGNLYVARAGAGDVHRYGSAAQAAFTVTLGAPSAESITVSYSTVSGSASGGSDFTAASGTITFAPGQTSRTILIQTLDDTDYEGNQAFTVNLSSPVGGVIVDGQGVGTIVDNDPPPTKFYVVNDGSPDRTYEYGPAGSAVENYSLNSTNSAPRGAASTAVGDKVWVVDANKKVYVYNAAGGLLGSWTAGSLASNATVEGIATNGTDIWIVDARQDKVFRYAGAASRLSGSQNASGTPISLTSGNKDPKDIVTDGASLWVVNDASTDKVFKYTLAGTVLGSWTIQGAGTRPTGITLDPASPSHLWIVDSGTDRVYQFDNAVSRTSQSQSPSTSFALAAGNTNPQGIADPPVAAGSSAPAPAGQDLALLAFLGELEEWTPARKKGRR